MNKGRDYITVYCDCFDWLQHLSNSDLGFLIRSLFEYHKTNKEPEIGKDKIELLMGWSYLKIKHSEDKQKEISQIREYVYFISDLEEKTIKIGMSWNPEIRRRTLQTKQKKQLKIIKSIETEDIYSCREKEKELHNKFYQFNIGGEWFIFSPEIRSYLETGNG